MTEEGKVEKQKISDALKAFRGKPLGDAALQLVEALRYHSPYGGRQYGAKEFLDDFLDTTESRAQMRARFEKRVNKIHAVSQVGQDELNKPVTESGDQKIKVKDGKTFLFLAIEIKDGLCLTRTEYAETTRLLNRHLPMPLIVIYRAGEEINIAFAQRQERDDKRKRDILGTVSLLRDISCEQPHSGHLSILQDLSLNKIRNRAKDFDALLKEWLEILSVETLNKNFYQKLSGWFSWAVKEAKFPLKAGEEHVIRLITRILFIWFIKEKGLVAEELFNENEIRKLLKNYNRKGNSYYRAILQNLFFATLNTEMKEREFSKKNNNCHRNPNFYRYADLMADKDQLIKLFGKTPFVNGGLFDCLDDFEGKKEGGERIDCFTDNLAQRKALSVPNALFFDEKEGLFSILSKYKFTVEESTPVDQEVALDPELLGRVFENLLATLNPETGEQARKSTGSFYTPRAVVDYMVREALVAYFAGKMSPDENLEERLRDLLTVNIDYENSFSGQLTQEEKEEFIQHTEKLRLLDPAVGSGAFPMGALAQMTMALERIDPENKILKEQEMNHAKKSKIKKAAIKTVERVFSEENNFNNYGRKLSLIRDCLFGVDIQSGAVQIARLRFFISLTIEQKVNHKKKNFGIEPLPNLETRLLAADTLEKIGRLEETKFMDLFHDDPEIKRYIRELEIIRQDFFSENLREKKLELRRRDKEKQQELADCLIKRDFPKEEAYKIANWDIYDQTATAGWFDSKWMLGVSEGFNIVIGNPPYVKFEHINDEKIRMRLRELYEGVNDLYDCFIYRGYEATLPDGVLSYIANDSFITFRTKKRIRSLFLENSLQLLVKAPQVFDAQIYAAIFQLKRSPPSGDHQYQTGNIDFPYFVYGLKGEVAYSQVKNMPDYRLLFDEDDLWLRVIHNNKKVGEFLQIKAGIHSGNVRRKIFFHEKPLEGEKLLQGKQINRYLLWWDSPKAKYLYCNPNYKCQPIKGIGPNGKPSRRDEWFNFHSKEIHYQPERLLMRQTDDDLVVAYHSRKEHGHFYTDHSLYTVLPKDGKKMNLKIIMAIMNSYLMNSIYHYVSQEKGKSQAEVKVKVVESLPLAWPNKEQEKNLLVLVDKILEAKGKDPKADTSKQEEKIDEIVYKVYGLTDDEIATIKSSDGEE